MKKLFYVLLITPLALLLSYSAAAGEATGEAKRRGPPSVAFDVCAAQNVDASCQFAGRGDHQVSGLCKMGRQERMVCVPDRHLQDFENRQGRGSPE